MIAAPTESRPVAQAVERSRPLLPVRAITSILDKRESEVVTLIENGTLLWAWDFSLQPDKAKRKMFRVLPACVAALMMNQRYEFGMEGVIASLLPADDVLTMGQVTRVFNCTETHVAAMGARRLLKVSTPGRRGPRGATRFTRESVAGFLRFRRYP